MCQCPERGDPHFYTIWILQKRNGNGSGVNALKGATFISTTAGKADGSYRNVMCQCPEWGDLHFHCITVCKNGGAWNGVNALKGATFISTLLKIMLTLPSGCVNALKGATFISTGMMKHDRKKKTGCQCPERGNLHFHVYSASL